MDQTHVFTVPDPKEEAFFGEEEKGVVEDLLSTPTSAEADVVSEATVTGPVSGGAVEAPKKRTRKARVPQAVVANQESAPIKKRGRKLGTTLPKKAKAKVVNKKGRFAKASKKVVGAPKTKGLIRSIRGGMKLVILGMSKMEKALTKLAKI